MKPDDQIVQVKLEHALKALHAVANLYLPNQGKELTFASGGNEAGHEEYLTVRQVAERIKYREQTLRNMMSARVFKRGIHYFKRRRRVVFLWSSVEQWLREDLRTSPDAKLSENVVEGRTSSNDDDQPFYPVHQARSRKRRQAVL
jgi:hypothetical protein